VVCDSNNQNVNDSDDTDVYPVEGLPTNIPGFLTLSIGLIIGITSVIIAIPSAKKLIKR
jgi:hypothetical protein